MAQVHVCLTVCIQLAAALSYHIARAPSRCQHTMAYIITGKRGACMCCTHNHQGILFVQGAAGPNSTTCQIEFNVLTCAGSCACAPPPPPPAPPIAAAPGCGYNTSLFSQQSVPPTGCTCCDAGFDYQDSCATQVITPQTLIHITDRA